MLEDTVLNATLLVTNTLDQLEVIGVIKTQGEHLDHDYLQHWARELNVQDLLEQALKER